MLMDELKPCATCGGTPAVSEIELNGKKYYTVYCPNGDNETMFYETREEAIASWNLMF